MTVDGYVTGIAVEKDANGESLYAVWPIEMPGCIAQAETVPKAAAQLRDLIKAYSEALKKRGVDIPKPELKESVSVRRVTFGSLIAIPEDELWPAVA